MKVLLCISVFLLCVIADEMYSSIFDNIDYEEILRNERLLKNYVNCLLDKGGCTPDGKELRRILPDAIETDCSKCSQTQKKGAKRVIQYLRDSKQDLWDQLIGKYDPNGEYRNKYEGEWLKD